VSRLDSFIRRMTAQRECLNLAARLIDEIPGPVLELGLGNGRTFDHLREIFPAREIYVFDRRVAAHPDCIPDDAHMILGDIAETLPQARTRINAPAALAHCDLGTGNRTDNEALANYIGPRIAPMMASGGLIVSDQEYHVEGWTSVDLPEGVKPGRYHIYRVG
jgi:S-adenosylmethionine-dependent methyltransferase